MNQPELLLMNRKSNSRINSTCAGMREKTPRMAPVERSSSWLKSTMQSEFNFNVLNVAICMVLVKLHPNKQPSELARIIKQWRNDRSIVLSDENKAPISDETIIDTVRVLLRRNRYLYVFFYSLMQVLCWMRHSQKLISVMTRSVIRDMHVYSFDNTIG